MLYAFVEMAQTSLLTRLDCLPNIISNQLCSSFLSIYPSNGCLFTALAYFFAIDVVRMKKTIVETLWQMVQRQDQHVVSTLLNFACAK